MKFEVKNMSHSLPIKGNRSIIGIFEWNCVGVSVPMKINNSQQKSLLQIAAAICQALPSFC